MIALALLVAVLVDTTLRLLVPGSEFQLAALPSIPLITAFYVGLNARRSGQLGYAIMLGLIVDCFSARPLGYFGFLLGTAAYLAWRVRKYVPADSVLPRMVACLFCGVIVAFFGLVLAAITGGGSGNAPGLLRALAMVTTSALSAPFVFGIWDRTRAFRSAFRGRRHYEWAS
ncbi:MAG: rod shape-determining protein MreD [Planctomycetota bacterium]|jgi:rod shape-determining protein MreD